MSAYLGMEQKPGLSQIETIRLKRNAAAAERALKTQIAALELQKEGLCRELHLHESRIKGIAVAINFLRGIAFTVGEGGQGGR